MLRAAAAQPVGDPGAASAAAELSLPHDVAVERAAQVMLAAIAGAAARVDVDAAAPDPSSSEMADAMQLGQAALETAWLAMAKARATLQSVLDGLPPGKAADCITVMLTALGGAPPPGAASFMPRILALMAELTETEALLVVSAESAPPETLGGLQRACAAVDGAMKAVVAAFKRVPVGYLAEMTRRRGLPFPDPGTLHAVMADAVERASEPGGGGGGAAEAAEAGGSLSCRNPAADAACPGPASSTDRNLAAGAVGPPAEASEAAEGSAGAHSQEESFLASCPHFDVIGACAPARLCLCLHTTCSSCFPHTVGHGQLIYVCECVCVCVRARAHACVTFAR